MPQPKILLIEDEATSRAILETTLTGAGYLVDIAESASVAHTRLHATRYALIIADWILPDGDGIYIADRAAARGSRTLVVTGHLSDLPVGTASRHHILMKPTKPESVLALVRALIGGPADQR